MGILLVFLSVAYFYHTGGMPGSAAFCGALPSCAKGGSKHFGQEYLDPSDRGF